MFLIEIQISLEKNLKNNWSSPRNNINPHSIGMATISYITTPKPDCQMD